MGAPRALILGCAGTVLDRDERSFLRDVDPWGFIVFARNIETRAQTRSLTADLRAAVGRDAPIFVDEEGGRVSRLGALSVGRWPEAADAVQGLNDKDAVAMMRLRYRVIADDLRDLGLDCNCAPLTDVAQPTTHRFLSTRTYGHDPARVARLARAVWDGLRAGGVAPVIKHLPGHGRTTLDTHMDQPVVETKLADLEAVDFGAVRALADAPMGMTCHLRFTALDPEQPATFSEPVIDYLRESIGFDGLLMTDDISMGALSAPMAERAARSLAAGCDVVTHCNGVRTEMEAVASAAPTLSGRALARTDIALAARGAAEPFDRDAALAALAALGREPVHA